MIDDILAGKTIKRPALKFEAGDNSNDNSVFGVMMCVQTCMTEADERKTLKQLKAEVENVLKIKLMTNGSVVDQMVKMMQNYSVELERIVSERTLALEEAQRKSDNLLAQMLPPLVARMLKAGTPVHPKLYPNVTVLFTDICNFTQMSAQSTPFQLVSVLNQLFVRVRSFTFQFHAIRRHRRHTRCVQGPDGGRLLHHRQRAAQRVPRSRQRNGLDRHQPAEDGR